ncbi:MAG: TonB-dependent receptor [Pyrinomonadaceae bacterium]|nr:TonB-dependent receptor [Pyrinomonadaceae bacterium]
MSSHTLTKRVMSPLLLTLLFAITAFGQTSASISGEVQDASGGAVPGARVVIAEPTRSQQFETTTSGEGTFTFPTLQPGTYTLTIEAQGFKQLVKSGIVINVADRQSAGTLALEPGEVTTTVEVVADAAELLIKTESGEQSNIITGQQVRDIALNGRNYLDLVKITPGVVSTVNAQVAGPGGLGSFSINGTRTNQHNLTIDGSTNVDTGSNGTQHVALNLDTIAEFKILTSNYQAEYGRSGGGDIKIVTRGGTNEFHGTGYLFHRHEGLNANDFRRNSQGTRANGVQLAERPLYRYNYYGYNVGGPIRLPRFGEGGPLYTKLQDRLFFFFAQEFQKQLVPGGERANRVPTAAELAGDFTNTTEGTSAGARVIIRDPLTGQPFPGNRIPTNRINPNGQAILRLFNRFENDPASLSNPSFRTNQRSQFSTSYPRREETIRIDYNVTDNTRIFGRYTQDIDSQSLPYGLGWTSGQNFPLTPTIFQQPAKNASLNITSTLSPTMTNEFIFGPSQNKLSLDPVDPNAATLAGIGLNFRTPFPYSPAQFINIEFRGTPGQSFAEITDYSQFPYRNSNTTFDFVDNLSKVIGTHTMKAGIFVQRSRKDQSAGDSIRVRFDNNVNNPFNAGHPYANALLGNFDSFRQGQAGIYQGKYRSTNVEWFVQDNWKATNRLTLDYGLRFNWIAPQYDERNQDSYFNPALYDPSKAVRLYRRDVSGSAIDPANPSTLLPGFLIGRIVPGSGDPFNGLGLTSKSYFRGGIKNRGIQYGPSVGFAYDVFGDAKTVLRGGYRIGYDRVSGNTLIFPAVGNPPSNLNPTFNFGNLETVGTGSGPIALGTTGVVGADPEGHVPNVQSYSLQVQREVGFIDSVVSVAYVGTLSSHLSQVRNLNYIPYGATFQRQNQDPAARVGGNLVFANGVIPEEEPGLPDVYRQANLRFSGRYALPVQFLRRYPGYDDIAYREGAGSSNYHSMQVTLQRRFNRGLTYGLAYTWSKAMGTAAGDGDFTNPIDTRGYDYRRLFFDRTHVMTINYVWNLPKLSTRIGDNLLTRALFDNWELSGITQFATGEPAEVTLGIPNVNLNQRITGSYTEGPRIIVTGDPQPSSDREAGFDFTAFRLPEIGSMGRGSRTYLNRPGINNTDLSVFKNFPFAGEGTRYLQLRVEMFNVFNHPQFNDFNRGLTFEIAPDFSNYRERQQASASTIRGVRGGQFSAAAGRLGNGVGEYNSQPGYVNASRVIQLGIKLYF